MNRKEPFKVRLQKALDAKEWKPVDLAKRTGISESTISQYRSGYAEPKKDRLQLFADVLEVNPAWLLGIDVPMSTSNICTGSVNKGIKINVLGRVAAGIPIEAIENVIDTEEIPESMAKCGEYFGLRIQGDSMTPRICDGDTVIVRRQDDAETDQIVIALINGNDATCKRLMKFYGGISLISFNPAYPPMMFTNEQIEKMPVKIIGRVVENRQKY